MPQPLSRTGGALPTWLVVVGSAAILYHLAGIIIPILDTPSGPWPSQGDRNMGEPPHFAHSAADLATLQGKYLRVAHSFHFDSNRPADRYGVEFEVRLKDADGKLIKTLRFPDPAANPWVRHRQEILAQGLAVDLPVPPPQGEVLAAPGGKVPTRSIWLRKDEDIAKLAKQPAPPPTGKPVGLRLETVPVNDLVLLRRDVWRPSEWTLVLAKSYSRYLCRKEGAASAEVVRRTRTSVSPAVLFGTKVAPNEENNPYSMAFDDLAATFQEVSR
jgi:hypothetical protein